MEHSEGPMFLREVPDGFPDAGEGIAAVGGEVLGDAELGQEGGSVREDFFGRVAAVELTEQPGDGFDNERIGITLVMAVSVTELGDEPQPGEAAFHAVPVRARGGVEGRAQAGLFDEPGQTLLGAVLLRKRLAQGLLFGREGRGGGCGFRCHYLPDGSASCGRMASRLQAKYVVSAHLLSCPAGSILTLQFFRGVLFCPPDPYA